MAEITKIYKGMQNGAETIDENFNKLNDASVQKTGNETIAGIKTFQDPVNVKDFKATGDVSFGQIHHREWGTSYFNESVLNLNRMGSLVFVMGWIQDVNTIPAGTIPDTPFPDGFKPSSTRGAVRFVTTEGYKYEIGTDGKLTFKTAIPANGTFTPVTACFITEDDFPS